MGAMGGTASDAETPRNHQTIPAQRTDLTTDDDPSMELHFMPDSSAPEDLTTPSRAQVGWYAVAAAAGEATKAELAVLEAHPELWRDVLVELLEETEEALASLQHLSGGERAQVVADFEAERTRLVAALERFGSADGEATLLVTEPLLQTTWSAGRIVAWGGGPGVLPVDTDDLPGLIAATGAPTEGWVAHRSVLLPSGAEAPAMSLPVADALGWLLDLGAGHRSGPIGASAVWLGLVAVEALRLVADGKVAPSIQAHGRRDQGRTSYSVRWLPALVDREVVNTLARQLPGSVAALTPRAEPRDTTQDALAAMVHAFTAQPASTLTGATAEPPTIRTASDLVEALHAHLDGERFDAPTRVGSELMRKLTRWTAPIAGLSGARLVVDLQSPDDSGGWHLSVLGPDPDGNLVPVEVAIVDHPKLVDQLERVERLLPALKRPGAARRGQVILSQDEAWELMTTTGPLLVDIGFDVRVPAMSTRRVTPTLRLSAEDTDETVVGAHQLTNVSWSALFGDVELTAADIARLSAQARPLVQSHGQWVELDKVDLDAAAAALAERADTTRLTGAEMLRQALGLEGTSLAGGTVIEGSSWAGELLEAARSLPRHPDTHPEGFEGTLRSYQAEAVAWLGFLHAAELGGCLALDMGLGKTPVMLAHLASVPGNGPALVIAPPAVVANWAAEAARFTPDLAVVVHHGQGRADAEQLGEVVKEADVVITTYGTAVRDIEGLADLGWDRIILDEAQAIKNPASETAQQLRRLHARTRLALTGTPIENGLGDLWSILDFTNPGLVGSRSTFISQLSQTSEGRSRNDEGALRTLNGILVFRRTKSDPSVAAELPERIDQLDHCSMTPEQIGLYQAVLDTVVARAEGAADERAERQGHILAAITALKQICDHPAAYTGDDEPLDGRSGKLERLEEIIDSVFAADERVLVFTHFAKWGQRLAEHLTAKTGVKIDCYHGGLTRSARDAMVAEFQEGTGPGALVLSLKAGGTGLNLTAANHVVLFDRWWNPAVEDQARDRAWRIGQTRTVVSHRLVCPGTIDERVEDVVADKRRVANLVLPRSSSLADLSSDQLQTALGIDADALITSEESDGSDDREPALSGDAR